MPMKKVAGQNSPPPQTKALDPRLIALPVDPHVTPHMTPHMNNLKITSRFNKSSNVVKTSAFPAESGKINSNLHRRKMVTNHNLALRLSKFQMVVKSSREA